MIIVQNNLDQFKKDIHNSSHMKKKHMEVIVGNNIVQKEE